MPGKTARSTLDQAFGLPEVLVAVSTSRPSCKRAGKTRTLMPVWDSSGESRIKALVQRIRGVGQFLQGRTGVRQGCCALTQPLDRVVARGSVAHGADAVHPRLGQIARRLLEGRPVLRLLRRQHQTRLERREPRLAECAQILDIELPPLHHTVTTAGLF